MSEKVDGNELSLTEDSTVESVENTLLGTVPSTAIGYSNPCSTFRDLLEQALKEGPKRLTVLYDLVSELRPQECAGEPSPHHKRIVPSRMEWQHQVRRDLHVIGVNIDGVWYLR